VAGAVIEQGGTYGDFPLESGERWRHSSFCMKLQDEGAIESMRGEGEVGRAMSLSQTC
jgi:hypothetical protein